MGLGPRATNSSRRFVANRKRAADVALVGRNSPSHSPSIWGNDGHVSYGSIIL